MKTCKMLLPLLIAALVLSLFAGCGSSAAASAAAASEPAAVSAASVSEAEAAPSADTTPGEAPAAEASAAESALEGASAVEEEAESVDQGLHPLCDETETLTYFNEISTNVQNTVDDLNDVETVKYLEEKTNVHIDFTCFTSDSYIDQMNLMIASGDMTDLVYNAISNYSGGSAAAIEDDVFIDLNEYLEYAPNFSALLEELPDVRREIVTDEGYLPAFYQISDESERYGLGLAVRQDWLDELGMDTPVTYDDFHEVLTAFKSTYQCENPIQMGYNGMLSGDWLIAGYGVVGSLYSGPFDNLMPFFVDGETVKFGPMEDGYREYLEMLNQWYTEGLFTDNFLDESAGNFMAADFINGILDGNIGMAVVATSSIESLAGEATDENFELSGIADAVKQEGDLVNFGSTNGRDITEMVAITTQCDNIELAMQWLDLGYTQEGAMLANCGIEGYTYTLDEEGKPVYTDLITNNPDLTTTEALAAYNPRFMSAIRIISRDDCLYSDKTFEAYEAWASNRTFEGNYPSLAVLSADETEGFNDIWSDLSTYVVENTVKFIVGERDLAEYDAFISEMEALDVSGVIDLKQAAYDRYLSK